MGRHIHLFSLYYVQLCVKGAVLLEGKSVICLDLVLKICSSGGIVVCDSSSSDELTFLNKGIACMQFEYLLF